MLGTIVDIFEAEVATIAASPLTAFEDLRKAVRGRLLRHGLPTEIPMLGDWEFMHPILQAMASREQEIASILHTESNQNDNVEIGLFRNLRFSDSTSLNPLLLREITRVKENLCRRGDTRLTDIDQTAREYVAKIAKQSSEIIQMGGSVFDAFAAQSDVPRNDIADSTTLREFKRLARLRKLTKDIIPYIKMDLEVVWPKLRDAQIPSEILQQAIRDARRSGHRASGSDLGDDYLACLAPYTDAIIVDKRTHEFLTQASRSDPYVRKIAGFFTKVSSYRQLPDALAAFPD